MVKEDEETEGSSPGVIAIALPGPARIRNTEVAVSDILQWMAEGQTEDQILETHSEIKRTDIRAGLAYAAERERKSGTPGFSERWAGKFKLPAPNPKDDRLTYLLERYERNRR